MRNYLGLFTVALSTLMYEILLTRVFSISLLYHFAFMVISVGMFGMTLGAIIVYLLPRFFESSKAQFQLALNSLLFGWSMAISFLCYTEILNLGNALLFKHGWPSYLLMIHVLCACILIVIPFTLSGIVICLALTKLPQPVNRLYAADLTGAAFGCFLLFPLLNYLDGASAMLFISAVACLAGLLFATDNRSRTFRFISSASVAVLILVSLINANLAYANQAFIRVPDRTSIPKNTRLYERWNSFSRVLVHDNNIQRFLSWGLSSTWPRTKALKGLTLSIDSNADTILTQFNGNWQDVDYLQHDVVNAVHQIKHDADVCVIGVGGGRDILSSLFFHQKHILAIEINNRVLDCLTNVFGNYTGHIDRYSGVTLVHDEARSFLTRSKQNFDIIQISLVDSFSATAAGAFVFTENALYTIEAWKIFMQHLKPDGVLSVAYWYRRNRGSEIYRFVSLAVSALKNSGVEDCRRNIIVIANPDTDVATMLVSRTPFSEQDLKKIDSFAADNKFTIEFSSQHVLDPLIDEIASAKDLKTVAEKSPINLLPPTDDSPFFFHVAKAKDMFNLCLPNFVIGRQFAGIWILQLLIITVSLACFACIFLPLWFGQVRSTHLSFSNIFPHLIYFCSIGLGFMFIEISQMEKLIVFLGHPVYGLSVVLFTLLLGSGIGSYCISIWGRHPKLNKPIAWLSAQLVILFLFGYLLSAFLPSFRDGSTLLRICVSIAILFPLGLFMGMSFPIGMMLSKRSIESMTPWLWGINGAASVWASVMALATSLTFGLSATFWIGFAFYCVAVLSYFWAEATVSLQSKSIAQ